jgi:multiple sugar transport system ATP-binding protein
MSAIVCSHLKKAFGNTGVIEDFNLEIADREFVVFLGPSGCGKSTMLRMMAGLEEISGGDLLIDGKRVNDLEPSARGVAMVFQNYALYPHMTIFENIAFGLRRQRVAEVEIEQRVKGVAEMLRLNGYLERKPAQLSGGQQQRVAIARAMIKTPKLFLFDEPLSNLDAKLRHHMRNEIARLHKTLNTTTVYVTHDQLEAMTLADRIVLMRDGNVEQVGTPQELYQKPSNKFVADFIGTPGMNFVECAVEANGKSCVLTAPGLRAEIDISSLSHDLTSPVVVGVRPQELVVDGKGDAAAAFVGKIDHIEFLGDSVLVNVRLTDDCIVAAVAPANFNMSVGENVSLKAEVKSIHVFDMVTSVSMRA